MSDVLFPVLVLVIWVSLGLTAAMFLGRHGRRSPAWYPVAIVLGPLFLPIALELGGWRGEVLTRTAADDGQQPRMTVLAAVDGSPESDDALTDAARVLAQQDARFVLLTVLDPDLAENDPGAKRGADRLLESRERWLPAGALPAVHEVAVGNPAELIVERAAAEGAAVVVMGRRGRGLSELLLGSVADQVVRRSPCPVLLGRAAHHERAHELLRRGDERGV